MTESFVELVLTGIREQAGAYRPTFNRGPEAQLLSSALKMNVFLKFRKKPKFDFELE
jgi:hypothetical protein